MKRMLITGGAGFIGTNTALYFAKKGYVITVFDNLSRKGTRENLTYLQKHIPHVLFVNGDIRDEKAVMTVVSGQDVIFHFAAQVAVTTSVLNPKEDFETNAGGTVNVLEAVRHINPHAIVIYSSTNKVYGGLEHLKVIEKQTCYTVYKKPFGIDETTPLDFHSPYGCSKGSADQYIRDYHRLYGLNTIVFRQSCIYGSHQFGVEDQGWLAWFLIATLFDIPLTIYGNGKQVRDLLSVDDLTRAYEKAIEHIKITSGQIYNIGGGRDNAISIWLECAPLIKSIAGKLPKVTYKKERPGDQPYFIADIRKANHDFGWVPTISYKKGIQQLYQWLSDNKKLIQTLL
ncbi:MAG: dTDP-D-glucose 4,6-dehydratase [Microgenomates group bacterium GW2011_GWC1_39_12]|nr:MAG: dTDP-D-glucose 4,6-dehydratase [Microgenomates group bacterium GW2011_GWC1_39_12]